MSDPSVRILGRVRSRYWAAPGKANRAIFATWFGARPMDIVEHAPPT
jgi:hypothetical protein